MALGDYWQQLKQEKQQYQAAQEIYGIMARDGLNGLTGEAMGAVGQKYKLGPEDLKTSIEFLKQTGLAKEAMQKYQTEVENTRTVRALGDQREAVTGKTMAETQTINERRPGQVAEDWASVGQKKSAAALNNANTNQVNTLTPVKVREGESRIAVNGSAANLNNTRAGDIIAKQPGEIAATAALTGQRRAAAAQNEAGGKANYVGQFIQSIGVKPGTIVSNVKDGSVNFTEKYVTGRQARDIMAAAKQQGIAIKGQGVWDEAGNLTGFYMTSAVYDPATAATQRLVTERPKAGAKPAAAPQPAAGKPVERTYDPKTRTFR